jgi:hypothetical protein
LNQLIRDRRKKLNEVYSMLESKDPTSNPNGLTLSLPSPKRTFSSRTTHTMILWSYLCGFGGKQIETFGKISMPVTFSYIHNIRTKEVVFYIMDME